MGNRRWLIAVVILAGAAYGSVRMQIDALREREANVRTALHQELGGPRPSFVTADAQGTALWKETKRFYQRRALQPAWSQRLRTHRDARSLADAIRAAEGWGLTPEFYDLTDLSTRFQKYRVRILGGTPLPPTDAALLDIHATYTYLKLASHVLNGDSVHARNQRVARWKTAPERFDLVAHLAGALEQNRVGESLEELRPASLQYRALEAALHQYRTVARQGGWPAIPVTSTLRPGHRGTAVTAVAGRLAASGDFEGKVAADDEPMVYDDRLVAAVKRFQRRHGLADSGLVDRQALSEMNVPVDRRIRQIELNLERWRWLPRDLGRRFVMVNIPTYRLELWEEGKAVLAMRVVVGKKDSPTPVFSDLMTHVVFSPFWNVPPRIAATETLPAVMKDPEFLSRTNMELVDASGGTLDPSEIDLTAPTRYRFRQRPGRGNSLGLVKFMFPNPFNVYLHDTPADSLFERATRAFSHGCVRVEDPEALAAWLLAGDPRWTRERLLKAMHSGQEQTVKLPTPVPVYLAYWTVSVSPEGQVHFVDDPYGMDAALGAARDRRRPPSLRVAAR